MTLKSIDIYEILAEPLTLYLTQDRRSILRPCCIALVLVV